MSSHRRGSPWRPLWLRRRSGSVRSPLTLRKIGLRVVHTLSVLVGGLSVSGALALPILAVINHLLDGQSAAPLTLATLGCLASAALCYKAMMWSSEHLIREMDEDESALDATWRSVARKLGLEWDDSRGFHYVDGDGTSTTVIHTERWGDETTFSLGGPEAGLPRRFALAPEALLDRLVGITGTDVQTGDVGFDRSATLQ